MGLLDYRLTSEEKAVQRKARLGMRMNNDDRKVIQARMRQIQRRGEYNGATAIPGQAMNKRVGVNGSTVTAAMQTTAQSMFRRGVPNFGTLAPAIEAKRADIEGGGTGSFSLSLTSSAMAFNLNWTITGSFAPTGLRSTDTGAGTGAANTGAGTTNASGAGTTNTSGYGVNGGVNAGTQSGVSASVPISGVQVGAGTSQGASANVNAGYSSTTTTGTSTAAGGNTTASGGASGAVERERYFGQLVCNYTIAAQVDVDWYNPMSWGASIAEFAANGNAPRSGSAQCGTVEFMIDAPR